MSTMILPLTVAQIAARAGAEVHQVRFVVATRKLPPIAKAGHVHLYDEATAGQIIAHLDEIKRTPRSERARRGWEGYKARRDAAAQAV